MPSKSALKPDTVYVTDAYWTCTVGPTDRGKLTVAADSPMREAIRRAFLEITGHEPEFLFSGWGQPPSESEQEYIDSHKRRDRRNGRLEGQARPGFREGA